MAIKKRTELKMAFKKGAIPTQEDFADLIDSFAHKKEDGWFNDEDGVIITPSGPSKRIASFFKNIVNKSAVWTLEAYPKKNLD